MENLPERPVLYTVKRAPSGLWAVCEDASSEEPRALFRDKDDAVNYADRLAEKTPLAEVEVME